MKSFVIGFLFLLLTQSSIAQCNAYLNIGGTGSDVTIEFVAAGAVNAQYIIDWGDGSVDTSSTPFLQHTYSSDGQFVLFYIYQDLDNPNCYFSSFDAIILTGGSCSMGFNVQTVAFVAALEAFSDNTSIPIYTVDWGDGGPMEVGQSLLHLYSEPGNYMVCVQMIDADPSLPCELYECQNIEITGEGNNCDVDLQVEVDVQTVTATITGNGGSNATYIIDWGDGQFDTNPVVEHTYPIPAIYNVCVYYGLNGNSDCQTSACTEVNIDPFASDCYFDFVPVATDLSVNLEVLSAGAIEPEYFFDWGDGSAGDYGIPASHVYTSPGTYEICGTYTDLSNPIACQLNVCSSITVSSSSGGCDVVLTVSQSGNEVIATAEGNGAVEPTYFIDWGDGSLPLLSSTGSHVYNNEGAFEVCATYSDVLNAACSATSCETIVVAGIQEWNGFASIRVWPNPVDDLLQIDFTPVHAGSVRFRLHDSTGRVLYESGYRQTSGGLNTTILNFDQMAAGSYYLECITAEGSKTIRVIK
jgi:PKD repeat protein